MFSIVQDQDHYSAHTACSHSSIPPNSLSPNTHSAMSLSNSPSPDIIYVTPKDLPDPFHINAASTTPSNTHIFDIKAQVFKPKGPRLLTLSFGTTKCLDTSSINPALLKITKSKGGKVQMEDASLIQSPLFTPVSPAQVKIEIDKVSVSLPPPSSQDVSLEEQINKTDAEI
jgi:hypothetical protein